MGDSKDDWHFLKFLALSVETRNGAVALLFCTMLADAFKTSQVVSCSDVRSDSFVITDNGFLGLMHDCLRIETLLILRCRHIVFTCSKLTGA